MICLNSDSISENLESNSPISRSVCLSSRDLTGIWEPMEALAAFCISIEVDMYSIERSDFILEKK